MGILVISCELRVPLSRVAVNQYSLGVKGHTITCTRHVLHDQRHRLPAGRESRVLRWPANLVLTFALPQITCCDMTTSLYHDFIIS